MIPIIEQVQTRRLKRALFRYFSIRSNPIVTIKQVNPLIMMSAELCSQHALALSRVCAQQGCSTIFCPSCFNLHAQQTHHQLSVRLTHTSVAFFLAFLDALIPRLDQALTLLTKKGPSALFKSSEELSTHWDWRTMLGEVTAATEEVVGGLRSLSSNNRDFVRNNSGTLSRLFHPEFFRDLYGMVTQRWSFTATKLTQDLRENLTRKYPHRYIYKRICFEFDPQFVADIEAMRLNLITKSPQPLTQEFKEPSKLSDLKISTVESVIEGKEDGKTPRFTTVDSFYEILENSAAEAPQVISESQPREEPKNNISPNFLSYQALERQAEELLLENERLRQTNAQLMTQNIQLRSQNARLKGGERVRK